MRRSDTLAALVPPEMLLGRTVVELPAGVELRVGSLPVADTPAPASAADENYRLIPLG